MKNHFDNNFRLSIQGSRSAVVQEKDKAGSKVSKTADEKQATKEPENA